MLKGYLTTVLILFALTLFSQDVIINKGFPSKKGEVLFYAKDSLLIYRDKSGELHELQANDMHQISEVRIQVANLEQKQVYAQCQIGMAFAKEWQDNFYVKPEFRIAANAKMFRFFQPGIGLGLDSYVDYLIIPVYLNAFGVSSDRVKTFFYNGRIGFGKAPAGSNKSGFENIRGDVFGEFEIGRRIKTSTNFFTYSFGYKVQNVKKSTESGGFTTTVNQKSPRITFKVGIGI